MEQNQIPAIGHTDKDTSDKKAKVYFGQIIFFEKIENAGAHKRTMARIALNCAGYTQDFPISLEEILAISSWDSYHEALNFLISSRSFLIYWEPMKLALLKRWAA